jgi:hypothetical protein
MIQPSESIFLAGWKSGHSILQQLPIITVTMTPTKCCIAKVSGHRWESTKHVLRQEFWDDDEYNYNFELVWKGMGFKVAHH